MKKGFTTVELLFVVYAVVVVSVVIGIGYAAFHFIAKFW